MSSHNTATTTNHGRGLRLGSFALAIAALAATSGTVFSAEPSNLPSSVKLQQWETSPQGAWITGALNHNNSDYVEGQVVPFRLEIPANVEAGVYQFSVCRNYENGTRRGYLYHAPFDTDRPAVPGGTISSTQDGFSAVNATLDSVTDIGGRGACKAGDREAIVVITKDAGAAYVLWGGHLASPEDPGVGPGNSAAYWPGASLHMKVLSPSKDVAIQTCLGPQTPTPSYSATSTRTFTATWTATATGTITVTVTATPTPSSTRVPGATDTPTGTPTSTATSTGTPTSTATSTPTDTATPPAATATESPASSPRPGATRTPTAAPATATPPVATATATRISEQEAASTQPRLLPATGTCGSSSDGGSSLWVSLLLGGAAAVTAAGGGAFWLLRHAHAAVR